MTIRASTLMRKYGIRDLEVYIEEMQMYEQYIADNFSQVHDEAWSHVVNDEEEEEQDM